MKEVDSLPTDNESKYIMTTQCCGLAGKNRGGCGVQMTYCLQVFTKSLRPPSWPNGLVGHRFAPPDSPPCGFYGERCKSDKGTPHACRLYSGVVHNYVPQRLTICYVSYADDEPDVHDTTETSFGFYLQLDLLIYGQIGQIIKI